MPSNPVRLQLRRTAGFDLRALSRATNGLQVVNVARPSKLGNPLTLKNAIASGYLSEVSPPRARCEFLKQCFREWLLANASRTWWQGPESDARRQLILKTVPSLRGQNLACFCPEGFPCHADVYLELANV